MRNISTEIIILSRPLDACEYACATVGQDSKIRKERLGL
jgi:hypothetical protein